MYITFDNKDAVRELLEDILQIDADIQMPDIPEGESTKQQNGLNDKDGDDDPDSGSSSGSPPPSKQPKPGPGDGEGSSDTNENTENGGDNTSNGFNSEEPREPHQHSVKIPSVPSKGKSAFILNHSSNFHLPPSPPHDVVFDDVDDDDFDDVPLPLLEPETQLEDGQETSECLTGILENGEEMQGEAEPSNGTHKFQLSSIKNNRREIFKLLLNT